MKLSLLHTFLVLALLIPFASLQAAKKSPTTKPAAKSIGELANPNRIIIIGAESFPVEQIKFALRSDLPLLVAAHPATSEQAYLRVVQTSIRSGYLRAGFADATVTATADAPAGCVIARITEGPRFVSRDVIVSGGNDQIDDHLQSRMTTLSMPAEVSPFGFHASAEQSRLWVNEDGKIVNDDKPVWKKGIPVGWDKLAEKGRMRRVKTALEELGYDQARFALDIEQTDGEADLHVRIESLGQLPNLTQVHVVGNTKNSDAEILDFLGLQLGQRFSHRSETKVKKLLWSSGRFATVTVSTGNTMEGVGVKILVSELDSAPPLSEPMNREQQAMLQCREWLVGEGGREFDFVWDLQTPSCNGRIVISPRGEFLATIAYRNEHGDERPFDHAVSMSSDAARFYTFVEGKQLTWPASGKQFHARVGASFVNDPDSNQKHRFEMGFGVRSGDAPFQVGLSLSPAYFVSLAQLKAKQPDWEGDVLTLRGEGMLLKVNAKSGRLLECSLFSEDRSTSTTVKLVSQQNALAKHRERLNSSARKLEEAYDTSRPISSSLAFFCQPSWIEKLYAVTKKDDRYSQPTWQLISKLVQSDALKPLDSLLVQWSQREDGRFAIPAETEAWRKAAFPNNMAIPACASTDHLFTYGQWPWHTWRNLCCVVGYKDQRTAQSRLFTVDGAGPLRCWLASQLVRQNPSRARLIATLGLSCCDKNEFRKELGALVMDDAAVGQCLRRTFRILCELEPSEIEHLESLLGCEGMATCFTKALTEQETDDITSELAILAAVDFVWDTVLKPSLTARFEALGGCEQIERTSSFPIPEQHR